MKKLCAISGVPLTTSSHFSSYFTRELHPLLEVKTADLLTIIGSKEWLDWQEEEAKLLFLALANSLGMLVVMPNSFARPSVATISSSIENLVLIAGWHSMREFPLPSYVISSASFNNSSSSNEQPSNEAMLEFPNLLLTILTTREEVKSTRLLAAKAAQLETTIKILYSNCRIGANKHALLRAKVADWAILVTQEAAKKERVTEDTLQLWRKMLQTAPVDAYKFLVDKETGVQSNVDLLDLDDFMAANLPHGCSASYAVMKQLTDMKNATISLGAFLGIEGSVVQLIPHNHPAPLETNFATRQEFLLAKAKWLIAGTNLAEPTAEIVPSIESFEVLEKEHENE